MRVMYRTDSGDEVELNGHLLGVSLQEDGKSSITIMPEKNKKKGHQPEAEGMTLYLDQVVRAIPEAEI